MEGYILEVCLVDKAWTCERAWEETEKILKQDPSRNNDPTLPFDVWHALHELDDLEVDYKTNKYALMLAIRICANHDIPLPRWASNAYIKAFDAVNNFRARTWDSVFGEAFPKGKTLAAARKMRVKKFAVWNDIRSILGMCPDTPIDDGLFEMVGKKHGLGKTLTSEYYYDAKKQLGF